VKDRSLAENNPNTSINTLIMESHLVIYPTYPLKSPASTKIPRESQPALNVCRSWIGLKIISLFAIIPPSQSSATKEVTGKLLTYQYWSPRMVSYKVIKS
jgi:hypothetical protein